MPRVSAEHLERRREQILEAALRCFARKGFHETSMQDVFTESGLSAGAVYRYFTSKDEIIGALLGRTMLPLRNRLAEIIRADPPPVPAEVIRGMTTEVLARSGPNGLLRLAPQAWALATVQPEAAAPVLEAAAGVRALWREYVLRIRDLGWIPADADADALAKMLLGLMPGFILQHLLLGDVTPDDFARGIELMLPVTPPGTAHNGPGSIIGE
ncbi:TetR/AcrR family transcriptional regulator [Nocardia sp. NPDC058176]|uniref:TetR/AcrR family transcriptional regulator n=1 Tax=Nocardia sp. NPDC058176 TaxID=3346368 RepID=UPI0036DE30CE